MEEALEEIKKEILAKTKDVELIFVSGSYAFGKMQKYSDIDMKVLTRSKPRREFVFRFIEHEGKRVLLTIHFYKLSHVFRKIREPKEWVWADKAYGHAKVLFDRDQNMKKLRAELKEQQVSPDYFFRFVPIEASFLLEYVGKLKNAYIENDELNIIYAARSIAEICYAILKPLNPVWTYVSERETYQALLGLQNKPKHYVEDFKVCYSLTMKERSTEAICKAAMRLAQETTDFLRSNKIETKVKDQEFLELFRSKEYTDFLRCDIP
jgi:predicted nucleotidyltransferase